MDQRHVLVLKNDIVFSKTTFLVNVVTQKIIIPKKLLVLRDLIPGNVSANSPSLEKLDALSYLQGVRPGRRAIDKIKSQKGYPPLLLEANVRRKCISDYRCDAKPVALYNRKLFGQGKQ